MSLFGHHHAASPTIGSRVADLATAVLHLPLEVWIAALPIAGGLAIAYVTYLLNLRRDRLALRLDADRRRADEDRVRLRVYTELSFRLERHRDALLEAAGGGTIARVEAEHKALLVRAAQADVIDALGKRYVPFMSLLGREESTLELLSSQNTGGTNLATQVDRAAALTSIESAFANYARLFAQSDEER